MTITIKSIAKHIGVSHSTVSRALSGSTLVADETAERVRQAALELGYFPSAAARSLKTNRTQVIGVIVSSIADPFFSEILYGIEECAQEAGYSLLIGASQHNPVKEHRVVQAMLEQRTDGLIVCSSSFNSERVNRLLSFGFPVVMVNQQAAENYNFSIYHNDVDGAQQITRHLIELGHKKIAYLGNANSGKTTLDRLKGFQSEMEANGLSVPAEYIYHVAGGEPELGFSAMPYFMDLQDGPTALICYNDLLAIGVLRFCAEQDIQIPKNFSVVGFDNISYSAFTIPSLTTFDQPKRALGNQAARLLLDLLSSDESGLEQHQQIQILTGKLLVRESTAEPHVVEKEVS